MKYSNYCLGDVVAYLFMKCSNYFLGEVVVYLCICLWCRVIITLVRLLCYMVIAWILVKFVQSSISYCTSLR